MFNLLIAGLCFWAASSSPSPWKYINFGFGVVNLLSFLGML